VELFGSIFFVWHTLIFSCLGLKCVDPPTEDVQRRSDGRASDTTSKLYDALASLDFQKPEIIETIISDLIDKEKSHLTQIQPLFALHSRLATSYRAKRLRVQDDEIIRHELYYWLQICRTNMFHRQWNPTLVTNQFMLAMLLHQVAFMKKTPEALSTLAMERHEIGLLYKHYMMQVAKNGVRSHGSRSGFVKAVQRRLDEEAAMVEGIDPKATLACMEADWMAKICAELESRLQSWASIR